jgi:lysozyme
VNISSKGIELLKQWEGFSNTFYKDIAGYLTVGVGHLVTKSELSNGYVLVGDKKIPLTGKLTDSEVSLLLEKDLTKFVEEVNSSIKVSLNQNQFDALVCFCYNIGTSAFKNSTF